jgi:hypothetical protein
MRTIGIKVTPKGNSWVFDETFTPLPKEGWTVAEVLEWINADIKALDRIKSRNPPDTWENFKLKEKIDTLRKCRAILKDYIKPKKGGGPMFKSKPVAPAKPIAKPAAKPAVKAPAPKSGKSTSMWKLGPPLDRAEALSPFTTD